MKTILYEHPLNERIRNYLKLEQLFVQAENCFSYNSSDKTSVSQSIFFNALFAILDTLERSDIRGDLIKEVEKLEQNLIVWSKIPHVDTKVLDDNLHQAVKLICQLKGNSPTWWQLKEDKFLASLKQRFAIQGGNSSFDLPQLQFWLHRPKKEFNADIKRWLALLSQIRNALELILKFIRQRAEFVSISTESGFYQDNGENLVLLRLRLPQEAQYYPTVSGNKFRYSIRFMLPCENNGRRYSNQATEFELAQC